MKRLVIRWAFLLPLLALLYFVMPTLFEMLGVPKHHAPDKASTAAPETAVLAPVSATEHSVARFEEQLDGRCRARKHQAAPTAKAEIYKWVDANGRTHFGDSRLLEKNPT